jgi:hypothetical protein
MWYFENKPFTEDLIPDGIIGFIYEITNLQNGRKYIGKKQFFRTIKRPPLKNKKRRRICQVKSDWEDYYGSSPSLQEDIEKLGKDSFKREILRFCRNKTELSYYEAEMQFKKGVLLSEDYYNNWIAVKITQTGL